MLTNKKAMSDVIVMVIAVALVLVAIAIVWAVVGGVINKGAEDIDYAQKCVGVSVEATDLNCAPSKINEGMFDCSVTLERATASKSDAIDGVGLTFSNTTYASPDEKSYLGNIVSTITTESYELTFDATEVAVRIYFLEDSEDSESEKHFC